ncbi:MAG: diaminopimelate decarboxylase [Planctomycetota bacterium]|nr:diaminopimelate decarboxylase [Planctomycetota bacterium]
MSSEIEIRTMLDAAQKFGTPLFLYSSDTIKTKARTLKNAFNYHPFLPLYACKANFNPHIIRILSNEGFGVDATSPGESQVALYAGVSSQNIFLTGSNLSYDDLNWALKANVTINLDSLSQIETLGANFKDSITPSTRLWLRYNPDFGAGGFDKITTAGPESKFGIRDEEFGEALNIAKKYNLPIKGLHTHIGSMLFDDSPIIAAFEKLLNWAERINTVEEVDAGGGIGVSYDEKHEEFPLNRFAKWLSTMLDSFATKTKRRLKLIVECGRFLVADAGVFLCKVTAVKKTKRRTLVGTDTGFSHFIRPALYNARHRAQNISAICSGRTEEILCSIVGNICESTDVLASDVILRKPEIGDIIAFHTAGAYCFSMASTYNGRPLPPEVILENNSFHLIRQRGDFNSLIAGVPPLEKIFS